MPDPTLLDLDALRAIAGTLRHRLHLPYAIEVCESDPLVIGFALLESGGGLRATAMVSRTSNMCEHALLLALAEEIHAVLNLCPLCGAEADVHRASGSLSTDCRACGRFHLDFELARDLSKARATNDAGVLRDAATVRSRMQQQAVPVTLTRESFAQFLQ